MISLWLSHTPRFLFSNNHIRTTVYVGYYIWRLQLLIRLCQLLHRGCVALSYVLKVRYRNIFFQDGDTSQVSQHGIALSRSEQGRYVFVFIYSKHCPYLIAIAIRCHLYFRYKFQRRSTYILPGINQHANRTPFRARAIRRETSWHYILYERRANSHFPSGFKEQTRR